MNIFKSFMGFFKNQEKRSIIVVFLITFILAAVFLTNVFLGDFFQRKTYDFFVKSIGGREKKPDSRVVLVLIDELSMEYGQGIGLGNWPWGRNIYSPILAYINQEGKPKGIFFDILFTEFDKGEGNDDVFQQAIAESGNIYQNILLIKEKDVKKPKPLPFDLKSFFRLNVKNKDYINWQPVDANEYKLPIPCLRTDAPCLLIDGTPSAREMLADVTPIVSGLAVASFKKDVDGMHRRGRILFNYGKTYLPSISLAAIKALYPESNIQILPDNQIKIGSKLIPVDAKGDYLINFYSKRAEKISMSAILQSASFYGTKEKDKILVKPGFFKDKIVIIGCSAVGCQDLKNTPVSATFPGPELHANIISNILQANHIIVEKSWLTFCILFLIIVVCVNSIVLSKSPLIQVGIPLVLIILYVFISTWLFQSSNYLSPTLNVLTTALFSSGVSFVYLSMTEGAERRKYSKILGNMVDPGIVSEALKDLEALKKGGEMEITAFFSDVAGFSTISEQLSSEDLAALLNEYLSEMTLILKEHGGTLDKYIGDAVVGIFGAPMVKPQNAMDAARASLDMIAGLEKLRKYWQENNLYTHDAQPMQFRLGLNTGKAKVGFMGTENLASYTMMGDTVNLAARLEAAAKDYGVQTLISESTKNLVWEEMFIKKLDAVRVKGKMEPVSIYELVGRKNDLQDNIQNAALIYEKGFELYTGQQWRDAIEKFRESEKVKATEDKAVALLVDRCGVYMKEPPPKNWDGVFTRTHK